MADLYNARVYPWVLYLGGSMPYSIEDCSVYNKSVVINGIPVYIFEKHNMALPAWGTICSKIGASVNLISFDTHTDTLPPYNCFLHSENQDGESGLGNPFVKELLKDCRYSIDNFSFQDVYVTATEDLKNTEQIKTAYRFGYIKAYTVVHKLEAEGYEEYDREMGYECEYHRYPCIDWKRLSSIKEPLIVDFDLDYFNSREDFDVDLGKNIRPLLKRAVGITIATEPDYFHALKKEDDFSLDEALEKLLQMIEKESIE